ncbi:fibronectin type III domain-containing protein [Comamonas serinivorans]|uniref:fibronectin type III domain-containing protein n=1 Tax=Comamonas serinivorans TaxID=1082851 RepID=UPI00196AF525|nr:fibronectin type III domain-containing protein [Comamonas serinivorans]
MFAPIRSSQLLQHLRPGTLALAVLGVAHSVQAAVQFELIPATQAWNTITQVGGVPVLPFDLTPQAAIVDITPGIATIPGMPMQANGNPAVTTLSSATALTKYTMGVQWNQTWANQYLGPIFFSGYGTMALTLALPARTTAFHLFGVSNFGGTHIFQATSDSGAGSGPVTVVTTGMNDAVPGLGFYTSQAGEFLQTIEVQADASFGIAVFGIAQAPDAPALSAATPAPGAAQLQVTAPTDVGTHAVTGYLASCAPQAGGAALTVTGSTSPLTVSGLTNGTTYMCTVAATSAAGTGPASGAQAVTPAAPVAATVAPVPALSTLGAGLLALLSAGLGAWGLRRREP